MPGIRTVAIGIAAAASLMLQGCYTAPAYTAVPRSQSLPEKFEKSWQAARAAAYDEGVRVLTKIAPAARCAATRER
jgi:hypothetical protein